MCILTDRITFSLPIYVSKVVISVNILERGEFEVGGIRFFFFPFRLKSKAIMYIEELREGEEVGYNGEEEKLGEGAEVGENSIVASDVKRVLVGAGARALFYPTLLYNVVRNKIQAEFRWWDWVDEV